MNKQFYTIIRVLELLYIGAYALYFLVVGYQLVIARPETPASTIPVLSTSLLQSDAKALDSRFVLPGNLQYTASSSGVFGKSEPFN